MFPIALLSIACNVPWCLGAPAPAPEVPATLQVHPACDEPATRQAASQNLSHNISLVSPHPASSWGVVRASMLDVGATIQYESSNEGYANGNFRLEKGSGVDAMAIARMAGAQVQSTNTSTSNQKTEFNRLCRRMATLVESDLLLADVSRGARGGRMEAVMLQRELVQRDVQSTRASLDNMAQQATWDQLSINISQAPVDR